MWFTFAAIFLTALAISHVCTWMARRWAPRIGLVDHPAARKVHLTPKPLGGGVAIWASVVCTTLIGYGAVVLVERGVVALPESARAISVHFPGMFGRAGLVAVVLGLATLIMIMGLVDDARGLG